MAEPEPLTVAEGHFCSPERQTWTWTWKGPLLMICLLPFLGLLIPGAVALFGEQFGQAHNSPAKEGEEGEEEKLRHKPRNSNALRMPCGHLRPRLGTSPEDTSVPSSSTFPCCPGGSPLG